ncbi:hypothetical protein Q5752_004642 [Cryptotrichosporon argae]
MPALADLFPTPNSTAPYALATRTDVTPNSFQSHTIIVACVYFFIILVAWNLPVLRDAIAGLKLLVVGTHELFHLVLGVLCGGQVVSVCIDPNDGGATHIMGLMRHTPRVFNDPYAMPTTYGQVFWSSRALATLAAGYIGSSIVGFLYITRLIAVDIVASKIASFTIAFGLLVPVLRADHWIAFVSIIGCEALLIGLWFGDHGSALRFYVLFVGMMHMFYVVWDYVDERLFDKRNTSDCAQFSELLGWPTSGWAIAWFIWDALVFTSAIFAGICVFRRATAEMYAEAASFLPTR